MRDSKAVWLSIKKIYHKPKFWCKTMVRFLGAGFILILSCFMDSLMIYTFKIHIHYHHHHIYSNEKLQMLAAWEERKSHFFFPEHWKLHYLFMTWADGTSSLKAVSRRLQIFSNEESRPKKGIWVYEIHIKPFLQTFAFVIKFKLE